MSHFSFSALSLVGTLIALVGGIIPDRYAPQEVVRLREVLQSRLMSKADYERMERGYYEELLDTGRRLDTPGQICVDVPDLRESILKPAYSTILPVGAIWNTNAMGMRDQPYTSSKPRGTFRLAMAGDSIGVGLGVDDSRGFEPLVERSLRKWSKENGGPAVEFLNFAQPGKSPGQRWDHFMRVAWLTEPDVVLFESTHADIGWDERRLVELLPRGIGWDSPVYGDLFTRIGIKPGETSADYQKALFAHRWELIGQVYKTVAADCRARGIPCLWVLIPRVGRPVEPADHRRLLDLARASGFSTVVDISDAYDGLDPMDLAIRPNDYHPNARGHALLAERLDGKLRHQTALRPFLGAASHFQRGSNVKGLQ